MRLFTSSFKSGLRFESLRTVQPRFPLTATLALGVMLALEALVAALPASWQRDESGAVARMATVERMILAKYDRPQVVVLGSSRAVFGVAPRVLDESLKLPPLSCVNASIIGGGPELMQLFYERNREQFRGAKLVVVNVDEWHFNDHTGGANSTSTSATTPPDAPLAAATSARSLHEAERGRCLRLRSALALLRYTAIEELGLNDKPAFDVFVDHNNQMWFTDGTPPHDRREQFQAVVRDYYRGFHIAPRLVDPLRKLAAMVREDGARLVLMQMPNRPKHQAEVSALAGAEYQAQVRHLELLADELSAPFYNFDNPAECGLADGDWADGVHLTPAGAPKFTEFLARVIERDKLL